jgi:hypothetical protein
LTIDCDMAVAMEKAVDGRGSMGSLKREWERVGNKTKVGRPKARGLI